MLIKKLRKLWVAWNAELLARNSHLEQQLAIQDVWIAYQRNYIYHHYGVNLEPKDNVVKLVVNNDK